jgi:hypothetical protein
MCDVHHEPEQCLEEGDIGSHVQVVLLACKHRMVRDPKSYVHGTWEEVWDLVALIRQSYAVAVRCPRWYVDCLRHCFQQYLPVRRETLVN